MISEEKNYLTCGCAQSSEGSGASILICFNANGKC